jgi:hypothetical protein
MLLWDKQMQQECAKSFQSLELLEALTRLNKEMLFIQAVELFHATDAQLY